MFRRLRQEFNCNSTQYFVNVTEINQKKPDCSGLFWLSIEMERKTISV